MMQLKGQYAKWRGNKVLLLQNDRIQFSSGTESIQSQIKRAGERNITQPASQPALS
jgi:hypothetical protein